MNYAFKMMAVVLALGILSMFNVGNAKNKNLTQLELSQSDVENAFVEKERGNFGKAFQIFSYHASKNKNHEAQTELGWMYHIGQHVDVDYEKAVYWYKLASEQGNGIAQTNLGLMYSNGLGVKKNLNTAKYLFLDAAQNAELSAMVSLSHLYFNNIFEEKNYIIKAYMWARLADKFNYSYASHNLEIIKKNLTRNQIKKAEELANECELKVFTNC